MKKILLQSITLSGFIVLIGLFVAFRSGFFGSSTSPMPMSPNGSVINSKATDSIQNKDSILPERTIISSSKSIVIKDFNIKQDPTQRDSMIEYLKQKGVIFRSETQRKQDSIFKTLTADSLVRKNVIFSGSKSGPIMRSEDMKKMIKDTSASDSIQNLKNE